MEIILGILLLIGFILYARTVKNDEPAAGFLFPWYENVFDTMKETKRKKKDVMFFDGWKLGFLYRKLVPLDHQKKGKLKITLPTPSPAKEIIKKKYRRKKKDV